jgi:hypothetical protein
VKVVFIVGLAGVVGTVQQLMVYIKSSYLYFQIVFITGFQGLMAIKLTCLAVVGSLQLTSHVLAQLTVLFFRLMQMVVDVLQLLGGL